MDKTSLQMLFGVLLGVFLLALIVITVVYVRRKLADKISISCRKRLSGRNRARATGTG